MSTGVHEGFVRVISTMLLVPTNYIFSLSQRPDDWQKTLDLLRAKYLYCFRYVSGMVCIRHRGLLDRKRLPFGSKERAF